jgi:hypothetical protein
VKELDKLAVESIYYSIFGVDVEVRYQEYLNELKEPS